MADAAPYLAKFRDFGPLSESYAQRPWNELGYEIAGGAFGPNGPNCKKDMTRISEHHPTVMCSKALLTSHSI